MAQQGYVYLHRKLLENKVIWDTDEKYDKRSAWIDLIFMVNHADKEIMFDGDIITIHRGQTLTSQRKLANRWNWHHTTVKRFIDALKKAQMITVDATTRATLISIVNYEKYQGLEDYKRNTNCNTKRAQSSAVSSQKARTECTQTINDISNVIKDKGIKEIVPAPPCEGGEWQ